MSRWKILLDRVLPWSIQLSAIILIGLVFFLGVRSERTGFVREVIDPGFRRLSDPVLNAFRAKPPAVEGIRLELDSASYDSLIALSEKAFIARMVHEKGNAILKATLWSGDKEIPVVIGLRDGTALQG